MGYYSPGKSVEGHTPHCSFDKNNHWLGLGASMKVSRVEVKQALVKQGIFREQESNHLEWPDHTEG